MISNKVLFEENGRIFQGLGIKENVIYRKRIEFDQFSSINTYKISHKLKIPWWWPNLLTEMAGKSHSYKLKFESTRTGMETYFMSFMNRNAYEQALTFLSSQTELPIKNCG